ncbi:response regulator transcription factor [Methylobacter marinus]|uniref:response regulator transcription factor n=1 Tax=Methylobacter marinus TaxID=34058 RepID=UPI000360B2B3|nr:LuxR C-terminal-related transcriptional regulator [Methylobacter marinus]
MRLGNAGTLTKTQVQIVQALSDGLTAEEVANARFRSLGTIRKHIEQARERLGARNIAQLVKLALQQGLIQSVVLMVVIGSATNGQDQRRMRLTRSFSVVSGRVVRHEV